MTKKLFSKFVERKILRWMISYRVNERRYEFGDEEGALDWVCSKIPSDGRVKKDCVPKVGGRMFNRAG